MGKKTIIIIGAGKGLGNHVAERFGMEGYRVILMSRNAESLKEYQKDFASKGIETFVHTVDAENPSTLTEALNWATRNYGSPDVLFYNVGITAPIEECKTDSEELMRHFRVDVASAYLCVRMVCNEEFIAKQGSVIITGGGLAEYPTMGFLPLSIDKAALRAMAIALHDEMKPKGVYVGTITVYGSIGIDSFFAPARIADKIWEMNKNRDVCEIKYAYPELENNNLNAAEYWDKVFSLSEKYK